MIAGGVGGISFWTSVYPFDAVKSRIQVESSNDSILTVLTKIYKNHGFRGLYSGYSITVFRSFIGSGVLFVVYENIKESLTKIVNKTN